MNLDKLINEVLSYLFAGYLENGGTPIFDVTHIIRKHKEDPTEIGKYLVNQGFVKNQQFSNGFMASISRLGINKICPDHFSQYRVKIISTFGILGNERISIMETLEFPPKNFQIAFDIAEELKNEGLIETIAESNDISIKLTILGRKEYDRNKADFLNL